ncbi:DUF4365 domain-containing protein [Devosia sp. CN2-171]|uniref:DUF4365 domain-containing protein n=1 Tax=Devosia sp. CN2-171 TaxID=3400909 RepID=UPI003BF8CE4B
MERLQRLEEQVSAARLLTSGRWLAPPAPSCIWGMAGVLTEPHIKEDLSIAYVAAVSARAGVSASFGRPHDYGVDGSFYPIAQWGSSRIENGFQVDFQLKASIRWALDDDHVVYDLEARAYNSMAIRDPSAVPLVVIVMCLPLQDRLWLRQNERALLLKNCCYWYWLPHGPPTDNASTRRIRIPRANALTSSNLLELLERAKAYNKGARDHV